MNDRDKNKEELILELDALRQKYDSLKELHDNSFVSNNKKFEVLQQSEDKYRSFIESIADGVFKISNDKKLLDVNQSMAGILGYNKEELLSINSYSQLFFADEEAEKVLGEEKIENMVVYRLRRKNGSPVWVEDHGKQIYDKHGTFLYYEGILRDITERKLSEIYREIGRDILGMLSESGSFESDIKHSMEVIKEATGADAVGIRLQKGDDYPYFFTDGFPDDFLSKENSIVKRNLDGGLCKDENGNISLECTCGQVISGKTNSLESHITKGGSSWTNNSFAFLDVPATEDSRINPRNLCIHQGYASIVQVPIRAKGMIIGLLQLNHRKEGCFTLVAIELLETITENIGEAFSRKKSELALKKSKDKLTKMLTNISDVIFIIDPNGTTSYKSINIERLFGWKPEELVGKDKCEVVHPDDQDMVQELMNTLREEPDSHGSLECRYRCKNGTYKWIEVTVVNLLHDPDINGFLGNYHDISERKSFRENLIKLKEKAEESDRLKSAFLINMSHEIRTPLNGILGFLDLLQGAHLSGKQKDQFSEIIKKSSDRLLSTLNDIITISKIESCQNELNISEFYVDEVLNDLYNFFQPKAEAKGLSLHYVDGSESKALSLLADKMKLESIVSNFIKNAIKFTNKGFIELGIKEKDGRIILYVTDTGIGIPQEKCESIFERFTQANMTHQREYEGSGLGLAISKSYAGMMDAKIWVESECDKGSTFYLSLKSQPSMKKTLKENHDNNTSVKEKKRLVLVAEDDEVSFIYLREVLSRKNFQVIRAGNGEEAIRLLKNHPDTDLVLMDLKMPVMDGWEATKQIRLFNNNIPIIAQTAYATADETERMKQAGCDHYLTKPVDSDDLMKCIGEYVV